MDKSQDVPNREFITWRHASGSNTKRLDFQAAPSSTASPQNMQLLRPLTPIAVLVIASVFASCSADDGPTSTGAPPGMAQTSVLDRASGLGLSTFAELAGLSTFRSVLEGDSQITVFAPDEAAFAGLAPGELDALRDPSNLLQLDALIGRSILTGEFTAPLIEDFGTLATLGGSLLQVDLFDSKILVAGAALTSSDASPDNGILHTMDRVLEVPLEPLTELRDEGFGIFADLVEQSGLSSEVQSDILTILAPTDAAFEALPLEELMALMDPANAAETRERLRAHLLLGNAPISRLVADGSRPNADDALLQFQWDGASAPTVNGAAISTLNVPSTTGLIHGIDSVLTEPLTLDQALTDPRLQAFETLLFASGIQATLEQADGITVFGPGNDAFLNLPSGVFDSLVQPVNVEVLRALLRSHLGTTPLPFSSLSDGDMIATLEGTIISVSDPGSGALRLDGTADFESTDVYLRNGVLHVISGVLAADGL